MIDQDPVRLIDPRTWPWVIWFWLALLLASWARPLWQRIQRRRATTWPVANGRIESVHVSPASGFLRATRRGTSDAAEIGYSYPVEGMIYRGMYKREFPSAGAAQEFVRDLYHQAVAVHYNPARPSSSVISESSVETLIQARPPLAEPQALRRGRNPVPFWIQPFLWIGVICSAAGLVVSFCVHVAALRGERVVPEAFFFGLHLGALVIWVPAVIVSREMTKGLERKQDYWKVALKYAPDWMRYMVYGFGAYAMVNFILFMMSSPPSHMGGDPPASVWRGFSGHWMVFYSAAMAILYSAANYPRTADRN
jgi:hypothetical protein